MTVGNIVLAALLISAISCSPEISSPAQSKKTVTYRAVGMMVFNADEQSLFDELTAGMPDDKAARVRAKFLDPGVVVAGTNEREQQLIDAIYASMRQRAPGNRSRPLGPPAATTRNTWVPKGDDAILINSFLNRYPSQYRQRIRRDLLRTDMVLTAKPGDTEGQQILDQIYERRSKRVLEAAGTDWR
jgi:hypothetical protein